MEVEKEEAEAEAEKGSGRGRLTSDKRCCGSNATYA